MSDEFNIPQQDEAALLTRLETGTDLQVHVTELELDEDVWEVVLHVYDETLKNFISKSILLSISNDEA